MVLAEITQSASRSSSAPGFFGVFRKLSAPADPVVALAAEFDALIVGRFSAAAALSSRNLSNSELVSSSIPSMCCVVETNDSLVILSTRKWMTEAKKQRNSM